MRARWRRHSTWSWPGAGDDGRLRRVLAASSFLVDGAAASRGAASGVILPDAAVIEVLPQFAGGLAP